MQRLRYVSFALVGLALCALPARADDTERMVPEDGAIQLMLLEQKCVRDSLKLTDDECKQVREHNARQWTRAQSIQKLPANQQDAQYEALSRENDQFLDRVLEPNQRKRLDEISLQVAGLLLATSRKCAAQLNLSDEQTQQLRRHQDEARTELAQAYTASDKAERKRKIEELRKTSHDQLAKVLTDQQKAKWKEMNGEKFDGKFTFSSEDQN